jgi:uncharacterized protein
MTVSNPVAVAVGIFVAYTVLVGVMWRVTGTRYDHLVDSREHIVRGIVVSIGVGAVFLAGATTVLGWWPDALFESGRVGPAWALVVPALFALVAALNIASIDFRSSKAGLLPVLLLGTLLVGFAEELASRGVLVVGLRESGASELVVWLVTAVLFALLHGMNAAFGQSAKLTLVQMVMAFLAGTVLYVTLMATGTLLVGMVLHALWDFGTLGLLATEGKQKPVIGLLGITTFAIGLIAVGFVVASA